MKFEKKNLDNETLKLYFKSLIYPRLIEEKMLLLLRQNKISKWFSGIGQEAISVGLTLALEDDEFILPMHRNLGCFTTRGIPLTKLFSQWQGKANGFTKGRDRSFHFGTNDYHIVGMISHLGPQMGVADGIGLASKLKNENKITAVITGDGGTSEGDFHEAINVASVWGLPVLFIIENNGYGLSTPSSEQFNFDSFVVKGNSYNINAYSIDGNNLLEVYHKIKEIKQEILVTGKPVILECRTFRMRGHEESSGTKYIPKELFDLWAQKDPIKNFQDFLINEKIISQDERNNIVNNIKQQINNDIDLVIDEEEIKVNSKTELQDVYKNHKFIKITENQETKNIRFVDAISQALEQSMDKFDNLILMGQDIAEYGGVFKVTDNFYYKYGKERVRNTPLCESAILGTGLGLSIKGYKSVVEMQFADFVSSGFTQIVNNLAKIHYRWGQNADVVVRMPTGAGVGAGPFHSQSNEAWFLKTPGLKIVYPSNPKDAKGLLISSIEDPNPVMFFEHKYLYRKIQEEVPTGYYNIELGVANVVNYGSKATILTYGIGVHWATELVKKNNYDVEIIDLRTLEPLDWDCLKKSIQKTNKCLILHEDTEIVGFGAELSAQISQNLFEYLDAPIIRVASLNTPVPFTKNLENNFLALSQLEKKLNYLISY